MEMLKGKTETTNLLQKEFDKLYNKSMDHVAEKSKMIDWLYEQYNLPKDQADLLLTGLFFGKDTEVSDDTMLRLFTYFDYLNNTDKVHELFNERDIKKTKKEKYPDPVHTVHIPPIRCVQVAEDQFIGAIPNIASFFRVLRDNRLVRYNPEAQRPLTTTMFDGQPMKHITVSVKAVKAIGQNLRNRDFISNTITLNIDPNTETEFVYDESKSELTFNNLYYFDITDGFHRYRAICDEMDRDPEFSYPMEIRITRFNTEKAGYFVWQEDQKVPMNKKESQVLNTKSSEMKVYEYIVGRREYLSDKFSKEDDNLIRLSDFISCVKHIYKIDKRGGDKRERITNVGKEINSVFNILYDDYICNGDRPFGDHINEMQLWIILKLIELGEAPSFIFKHWHNIEAKIPEDDMYRSNRTVYKFASWNYTTAQYCYHEPESKNYQSNRLEREARAKRIYSTTRDIRRGGVGYEG